MKPLKLQALILVFSTLPLVIVAAEESNPQIVADKISRQPWLARLETIPETLRGDVFAFLRSHPSSSGMVATLIRLGDSEVKDKAIEAFKRRELRPEVLEKCGDPSVIADVIDIALRDEPVVLKFADDIAYFPPSVDASNVILQILARTPEIPNNTREWAAMVQRSRGTSGQQHRRAAVRAWWPQNKAALLRRDYAALKPLEGPIPEEPAAPKSAQPPTPVPATPPRLTPSPNTPQPRTSPAPAKPLVSPAPSLPTQSAADAKTFLNRGWLLAGAGMLVMMLGIWWWKRGGGER